MVLASTEKHVRPASASRTPNASRSSHSPANLLAHDTRNWLTVLQVYCDLLQTAGAEARYPDWIRELSAAVSRGQALVGSLLDSVQVSHPASASSPAQSLVSASASKDAAEECALLDVARAIERRLPMLQQLAGPHIRVHLEADTECVNVAVAEGDFDRILHNLAVNALEAMPQGGDLRMSLSAMHVERAEEKLQTCSALLLRVSDTGTGISPSLLPYIFQPGVSGKKLHPGHREGECGFGLAIVRDLTLRAGGTVRVRSHPGRGTSFEIELPIPRPSPRQTTRRRVSSSSSCAVPAQSSLPPSTATSLAFPPRTQGTTHRVVRVTHEAATNASAKRDRLRRKA